MASFDRELSPGQASGRFRFFARWAVWASVLLLGAVADAETPGAGWTRDHRSESRARFCRELTLTVRADHPAVVPVAEAIRAVTENPLEQLIMVNDVVHLLVDYDEDERVYGKIEFHATLDEMIARRREGGWPYLRDDCDGRAILAAHLLASLAIPWQLQASYWKRHAWITATVEGVEYDLLDLRRDAPERRVWSYKLVGRWLTRASRTPPYFNWRRAWIDRAQADLQIGLRLGAVELNSIKGQVRERFAVDWTRLHPGGRASPFDPRMTTAPYAVFPYGESLRVGEIVSTNTATTGGSEETGKVHAPLGQASALASDGEIGVERNVPAPRLSCRRRFDKLKAPSRRGGTR